MPTPFYHLALAQDMLASDTLSAQNKARLEANWSAFLFGNIAADAQSLNHQKRVETHFFNVPFGKDDIAYETMFASHPELEKADDLAAAHALFIAGYMCHLWLDQRWIVKILMPVFVQNQITADWTEAMFLHNVLRVHIDRQILPQLDDTVGDVLVTAEPTNWLPFVTDSDLVNWRNFVALQLQGKAPIRTVEVFAQRMKRDPAEFENLLSDKSALHERILQYCSSEFLSSFRAQAAAHSVHIINTYLNS